MSDPGASFKWTMGRRFYGPRWLVRGLKARIVASIAILAGGVIFSVGYLGFLATHFPWYENLTVVLLTAIVVPVALGVMWVLWGLGIGDRMLRDANTSG